MGTMEKMPLTDQELHCIARHLQVEMYTPEERQSRYVEPCWLCKYSFTCHPPLGFPGPSLAHHRCKGVKTSPSASMSRLSKLTGVEIYACNNGKSLEEILLRASWAEGMSLQKCIGPFEKNIEVYTRAMAYAHGRRDNGG